MLQNNSIFLLYKWLQVASTNVKFLQGLEWYSKDDVEIN